MSAMQFLAATLSGAMVGVLHNGTGQPLALVMSVCGVLALGLHRWLTAHPHETMH
jgi:DHA1 family bicyclomycin/chloramphenicol resistance-like MFS transporter